MELDRHVPRAGNLQRARRHEAVVRELAVREVADQDQPVLVRERDRALEVLPLRHRTGRVVRVVHDQDPRAAKHVGGTQRRSPRGIPCSRASEPSAPSPPASCAARAYTG